MDSTAKVTNLIAKVSNSIAKTCTIWINVYTTGKPIQFKVAGYIYMLILFLPTGDSNISLNSDNGKANCNCICSVLNIVYQL